MILRPLFSVTTRALISRINRRLKRDDQMLCTSRGARNRFQLGEFFVMDWRHNFIVETHVELEALGRELGALAPHEQVVS